MVKAGLKLFVQHVEYSTLHNLIIHHAMVITDYKLTVQLNSYKYDVIYDFTI